MSEYESGEPPEEQPSPPSDEKAPHPVRLVVSDDLGRSRLTVFFRLILAIPHFIWIYLWTYTLLVCLPVMWFAALIAGHTPEEDRKSTRLNSSHITISYAVFCLKK